MQLRDWKNNKAIIRQVSYRVPKYTIEPFDVPDSTPTGIIVLRFVLPESP